MRNVTSDTQCQVCGRQASRPYRDIVAGRIVAGCVARLHDEFLPLHTNTRAWAMDAKRSFRNAKQTRLTGIGGK